MKLVASDASASERSGPPVMLTTMLRAPRIESFSSSGFETARCAAVSARSGPSPMPIPMTAWPMPFMIERTSAKSTLIWPGWMMMSVIPCTACSSTSSATLNASCTGVFRGTLWSTRSFGIAITESAYFLSSSSPSRACSMRRLPSSANGSVTTATVST